MRIVIERRFQVGLRLLTSLCFLALLLRFQYVARMMRLIDLKLLWIYGRILVLRKLQQEIFPLSISVMGRDRIGHRITEFRWDNSLLF